MNTCQYDPLPPIISQMWDNIDGFTGRGDKRHGYKQGYSDLVSHNICCATYKATLYSAIWDKRQHLEANTIDTLYIESRLIPTIKKLCVAL